MDPQATLRFIEDNLDESCIDVPENQPEDVIEALNNLNRWIARGGFQPNWTIQQNAVKLYRNYWGLTSVPSWKAYRAQGEV